MPKETIQDTAGTYDVRVGWAVDREVQVGVETAAGFSLVSMLYGNGDAMARISAGVIDAVRDYDRAAQGSPEELGRRVLDIIESSQSNPGDAPSYTGVWSTLDRHSINRLIKTLRRARDAAYGRDE